MPKQSAYLKKLQQEYTLAKTVWEDDVRMHNRIMTLDIVTITLIVYAKDRIDRLLKEYVPEDMFVPFDKRYER